MASNAQVLVALGFDPEELAAAKGRRLGVTWWTSVVTAFYEALDLVSVKIPGPASWLEIDRHVRLFIHVEAMAVVLSHLF